MAWEIAVSTFPPMKVLEWGVRLQYGYTMVTYRQYNHYRRDKLLGYKEEEAGMSSTGPWKQKSAQLFLPPQPKTTNIPLS